MAKKSPCGKCKGLCCRYVALPIENPETREDFDEIRWYLTHENIQVYVEEGEWYIQFNSRCRHLKDNKCDIYPKLPTICRKYSKSNCDLTGRGYEYELHFKTDAEMQAYMAIKFDNRGAK